LSIWFAEIMRKQIPHGSFRNAQDLEPAIYQRLAAWNGISGNGLNARKIYFSSCACASPKASAVRTTDPS
jgi:hypothetical protein